MIAKNMVSIANCRRALACGVLFAASVILPACDVDGTEHSDDAATIAEIVSGSYVCGYALPGYNCNNGRTHAYVSAADMTTAIAACPAARPPGYADSCYVIDSNGNMPLDATQCSAAGGSWRPGNSCCNFKGTLSCPATRSYFCGYALPGYNCNNGRTHATVNTADMTAAIAACPAARPPGYTDFCYVIDSNGGTVADMTECSAAGGSWRAGNNCCNFKGSLSCP